jgi:hypothetical protein
MTDSSARTAAPASEHPSGQPRPQLKPAPARRRGLHEQASTRLLATIGIVGIATILGAVLVSQNVSGWIIGLAVGLMSAVLTARLWSSHRT